jgi:hypothetical protein
MRYLPSILTGKGYNNSKNPTVYTWKMPTFSMDDLVVTGALGLIGFYLAAVLLLFAIYSVVRPMYSSLTSGNFGLALGATAAIVIAGSFYLAIGRWLHETGRI